MPGAFSATPTAYRAVLVSLSSLRTQQLQKFTSTDGRECYRPGTDQANYSGLAQLDADRGVGQYSVLTTSIALANR